jgi:hypothetical protein
VRYINPISGVCQGVFFNFFDNMTFSHFCAEKQTAEAKEGIQNNSSNLKKEMKQKACLICPIG